MDFFKGFSTVEGFHSTDCPSEWGLQNSDIVYDRVRVVSIQLIAPASGASNRLNLRTIVLRVSIQLIAPASGAYNRMVVLLTPSSKVSIQLIAPASGAPRPGQRDTRMLPPSFPFN